MIEISNETLRLSIKEDCTDIIIEDIRRRLTWRMDNTLRRYYLPNEDIARPLPPGHAVRKGPMITTSHAIGDHFLEFQWTLDKDFVQVTVDGDAPVTRVSLPGPMLPQRDSWQLAVPLYQGCLIQNSGQTWEMVVGHGGHERFSMAMGAILTDKGSLITTHSSPTNWQAAFGESKTGTYVTFEHEPCPVDEWRGAQVRLYPCDSGLTAACKKYRQLVQQRGDFQTWEQKIEAKPILKNLFGALIAFIGYNKTDQIDYLKSTQKLKAAGFDKILFYPVRMCHYSLGFQMGGDDPIWFSDELIQSLHSLGGIFLSPWVWIFEGLDDGSAAMDRIYRKRDGRRVAGWRMDNNRWYRVCTPYQMQYIRERLATDMKAMDWLHFDVNATVPGFPCMNEDHQLHGGKPLSSLDDMAMTRKLLSPETVGNRIVSSEGFNDYHTPSYDIGSTKIMPMPDNRGQRIPVPMTMLVFHDSCIHDWWELQNYNSVPGWGIGQCSNQLGRRGTGEPQLKAAIDALYGCPPNLFPFGKQYAWVDKPLGETYSIIVRMEDDSVQQAIHAALPVAKLHEKIGMLEMTDFQFLSDDRYVQSTTFSDGTRIVSNLSPLEKNVDGLGLLSGYQWKQLQ